MKTAMQVYATLKRKVTAIIFLLSLVIMMGWPISRFYAQQVYATSPNPGCDPLVIQIGSAQSLLTANLLSNITITTCNGATSNGDATTITPSLLTLLEDSSTALIVIRPPLHSTAWRSASLHLLQLYRH